MLGDTLVLPLLSGNVTVVKINQDGYSSEYLYSAPTYEYRVKVRHTKTGKDATGQSYDRHNFEATKTTFAAGAVPEFHLKFYFVIECLPGNTSFDLADGICDLAIASSDALLTKLMGWES